MNSYANNLNRGQDLKGICPGCFHFGFSDSRGVFFCYKFRISLQKEVDTCDRFLSLSEERETQRRELEARKKEVEEVMNMKIDLDNPPWPSKVAKKKGKTKKKRRKHIDG